MNSLRSLTHASWSPTGRLLVGLAGVALAFYGVRKGLIHGDADEWAAHETHGSRAFKHVS
jgi:hypothetical protein